MVRALLLFLSLVLMAGLTAGCSPRDRGPSGLVVTDGGADAAPVDPRCWSPESIVPEITCGSELPEVVCPGSCRQTLEGIQGVGLSSCRCMDKGNGFGGQWVCDTSRCDEGATDGGIPAGSDGGVADAGAADTGGGVDAGEMCPPVRYEMPTVPGCTRAQRTAFTAIESQADYDSFARDPANTECNNCLSQSILSCATSFGCDDEAGELNCCMDARCGRDDTACRQSALEGECAPQVSSMNRCVMGASACLLNPGSPPPECFP